MFKKITALFLGIFLISSIAFADNIKTKNLTNEEIFSSFDIIEPAIKVKKEIFVRENLLISLALYKDFSDKNVPLEVYLYKVEPKMEKLIDIEDIKNISEIEKFDIVDNLYLDEKEEKNKKNKSSVFEAQFIPLPEFNKDYADMTTIQLVEAYKILDFIKKEKLKELEKLYVEYKKILDKNEDTEKYTAYQKNVVNAYDLLSKQFAKIDNEIEKVNNILDAESLVAVLEGIKVKKGILPFFKYTVENIKNSEYRLEFRRFDTDEVIYSIDFFANKKDDLTKEKIKKDVPSALDILNSDKKDVDYVK